MNILWECLALIDVLSAIAGSAQYADGCAICRYSSIRGLRSAIERNLHIAQECADPATAPNTSISAKHSHSMFILSRGDMVKHEVGVWVCVHVCAVCVCSESMNDVTVASLQCLCPPLICNCNGFLVLKKGGPDPPLDPPMKRVLFLRI